MANDLVYTTQLIDAVLKELKDNLPAGWITTASGEARLKTLEHGALSDWVVAPPEDGFVALLPAIIVRPFDITDDRANAGTGRMQMLDNAFRLVHIRCFDQCYTSSGAREWNMTKARARYAKIIGKALFDDVYMGNPTLTSSDAAWAKVVPTIMFRSWDIGTGLDDGSAEEVTRIARMRQQMWAIACDFEIKVSVG